MTVPIDKRLKVWRAMSDLFLDTEIDDFTFQYIARTVKECGYTPEETRNILWQEVFPVLASNLSSPAGVWSGWPDEWIAKNIKVANPPSNAINGSASTIREIKRCWENVSKYLPPEYA